MEVGISAEWGGALEQNNEKDRIMEGTMKEKDRIRKGLTELLNGYYDGFFPKMVCDYIQSTGMTPHEVKEMLAAMRFCCSY